MAKKFQAYTIKETLWQRISGLTCLLAVQTGFDREVELRTIVPGNHSTPERLKRFVREFKVLARLDHPHITPVLDAGHHGGTCFYTTVIRHGPTLAELSRNFPGGLEPDQIFEIAIQIGSALAHMHGHKVIHRDLNLTTIRYDEEQESYFISEFSAVKALDLPSLTVPGTPPKEQSLPFPEDKAEPRTDQFLLGCVLLSLALPRKKAEDELVCLASSDKMRKKAVEEAAGFSFHRELLEVIERLVDEVPKNRYHTMQHVVDKLRHIQKTQTTRQAAKEAIDSSKETAVTGLASSLSRSQLEIGMRKRKRGEKSRVKSAALGAAGLACVALAFFFYPGEKRPPPPPILSQSPEPTTVAVPSSRTTTRPPVQNGHFLALHKKVCATAKEMEDTRSKRENFMARIFLLQEYYRAAQAAKVALPFSRADVYAVRLRHVNDAQRAYTRLGRLYRKAAAIDPGTGGG